jgi:hypothetical protein
VKGCATSNLLVFRMTFNFFLSFQPGKRSALPLW